MWGSTTGWTPKSLLFAALAAGLLAVVIGLRGLDDPSRSASRRRRSWASSSSSTRSLAQTIEAYNYANIELDRIDADLRSNARHLRGRAKEPRGRAVADRRAAPRPVRERRRRLDARGDLRSAASTTSSRSSTPSSASRARTRDPQAGQALPEGGRDTPGAPRGRPRGPGAGRRERRARRSRRSKDASRAPAAARVGQGRDRADAGRGGAPTSCSRRPGTRELRGGGSPPAGLPGPGAVPDADRVRWTTVRTTSPSRRHRRTGVGRRRSSGSRCSTSVCRTSGAA